MGGDGLRDAVTRTHEWFDAHRGWAPPDPASLAEWVADGRCRCPDGCIVAPAGVCGHGLASWWLVLVTLDPSSGTATVDPRRLTPRHDRLDPGRADFVAVMDAHHGALVAGHPGYPDPASGLTALTARTLWERGSCCGSGCRHCPYEPGERAGPAAG